MAWYNPGMSAADAAPGAHWRLFVAVGVPQRVRDEVADAGELLRPHAPEARWTDPAGWHLTLAFLGSVATAQVGPIETALAQVAASHPPFTLALTGQGGMFGRRVLWVGIGDSPELSALTKDVRAALEPLGFPPDERPFHPHLTLARARKGSALPRGLAERYAGPTTAWTVETLDLMRSHLSRAGAWYERVGAWPLAAAPE